MNAGCGRVERQFADRNAHASCALITQSEDSLVVGGDNQTHVLVGHVLQDVRDAVDVIGRNPDAARMPQNVTELLAGAPDGRRVDDRQQFGEVFDEQAIEERLIAVLQGRQADVLFQVVALRPQVLEFERHLFVDGQLRGGRRPCKPRVRRSSAVKAASLFNSGF